MNVCDRYGGAPSLRHLFIMIQLSTSSLWLMSSHPNDFSPSEIFLQAKDNSCCKVLKKLHLFNVDVSFLCFCPVIDHEFCHNIVKVAVDPGGDSQVDLQTTLTML